MWNNFLGDLGGSSLGMSQRDLPFFNARQKVNDKYYRPTACEQADLYLKTISDEIVTSRAIPLKSMTEERRLYIQALEEKKAEYEGSFTMNNCREKITEKRLKETAKLSTQMSMAQETTVLGKNYKEQKIYIGIGALVLLVGLVVIIKE